MNTAKLEKFDQRQMANVALQSFFNISKKWHLSAQDQMTLLGEPSRATFYKWRKGEVSPLSKDTIERISYILGIYKALRLLFQTEAQADAWLHKPNDYFSKETALSVMLKGRVVNLAYVRRYLDYIRG